MSPSSSDIRILFIAQPEVGRPLPPLNWNAYKKSEEKPYLNKRMPWIMKKKQTNGTKKYRLLIPLRSKTEKPPDIRLARALWTNDSLPVLRWIASNRIPDEHRHFAPASSLPNIPKLKYRRFEDLQKENLTPYIKAGTFYPDVALIDTLPTYRLISPFFTRLGCQPKNIVTVAVLNFSILIADFASTLRVADTDIPETEMLHGFS